MPLLPLPKSGAAIHPGIFSTKRIKSTAPLLLVQNIPECEAEPHKKTQSTKVKTTKVGIDSATAISNAAHFVIRAPGADFPKTVTGFVMVSLTIL